MYVWGKLIQKTKKGACKFFCCKGILGHGGNHSHNRIRIAMLMVLSDMRQVVAPGLDYIINLFSPLWEVGFSPPSIAGDQGKHSITHHAQNTYTHTHIHTYTETHTQTHTHTHRQTHAHTHSHTHTHTSRSSTDPFMSRDACNNSTAKLVGVCFFLWGIAEFSSYM